MDAAGFCPSTQRNHGEVCRAAEGILRFHLAMTGTLCRGLHTPKTVLKDSTVPSCRDQREILILLVPRGPIVVPFGDYLIRFYI